MKVEDPIIYVYLYSKIREKTRGNIVRTKDCREIIREQLKSTLPRYYDYDIIKELRELNLLRRIDHTRLEIIKSNCTNKLKQFP